MTKISSTVGGIRPPFGPNSTEHVQQKVTSKESVPIKPNTPNLESAPPKDATGDKHATELKVKGERVKSELNSKLETKGKEVSEQVHPGFAPPLVPVGPVVTGDNLEPQEMRRSKRQPRINNRSGHNCQGNNSPAAARTRP